MEGWKWVYDCQRYLCPRHCVMYSLCPSALFGVKYRCSKLSCKFRKVEVYFAHLHDIPESYIGFMFSPVSLAQHSGVLDVIVVYFHIGRASYFQIKMLCIFLFFSLTFIQTVRPGTPYPESVSRLIGLLLRHPGDHTGAGIRSVRLKW